MFKTNLDKNFLILNIEQGLVVLVLRGTLLTIYWKKLTQNLQKVQSSFRWVKKLRDGSPYLHSRCCFSVMFYPIKNLKIDIFTAVVERIRYRFEQSLEIYDYTIVC